MPRKTAARKDDLAWVLFPGGHLGKLAQHILMGGVPPSQRQVGALYHCVGELWGAVGDRLIVRRQDQWHAVDLPSDVTGVGYTNYAWYPFLWFHGRLWCGGPALLVLDNGEWRRAAGAAMRLVYALAADPSGHLWCGSYFEDGLWRTADGTTWEPVPLPSGGTNINALHADAHGGVWVAERGNPPGVAPIHYWYGGAWHTLPLPERPRWFRHIEALVTDPTGALWAGSRQFGLYRWDGAGWTRTVGTTDLRKAGLPGSGINGLAVDPRGRVWAATHGGIGVYADGVWRSVGIVVETASDSTAIDLWAPMQMPTCLHLDEQGRLWVGTGDGHVVWIDTGSDAVIVDADAFMHVYRPLTVLC